MKRKNLLRKILIKKEEENLKIKMMKKMKKEKKIKIIIITKIIKIKQTQLIPKKVKIPGQILKKKKKKKRNQEEDQKVERIM